DRLAGRSLEHEQKAVLRRLRDDVDASAVSFDRQKLWGLRQVVVPEIVMHQLLVPEPLAGAGVQRDERIAEQVVARTIAAEEVVARAAERDEDDAVLLVDGHLAPVVHAAGRAVSVFGP